MKITMSYLLKTPTAKPENIATRNGDIFAPGTETLFSVDVSTLTATMKPFDFTIAKTARAPFVEAVRGEYFARDLAKLNDIIEALVDIDDAFFAEAREDYTAEQIETAKTAREALEYRARKARDFIERYARTGAGVTVSSLVSALRREALPAEVKPAAEAVASECKTLNEAVNLKLTPEDLARFKAIVDHPEDHPNGAFAEASKALTLYDLAEGQTEGLPNMRPLREAVTKLISKLWVKRPADGVEGLNFKCPHALAVEIFQRSKRPREVSKKGVIRSLYSSPEDLAREVILAVFEEMQKMAKTPKTAEAKTPKTAEAKTAKTAEAKTAK